MPIYEYHCEECGHEFQVVTTIADHRRGGVNCPHCSKNLVVLKYRSFHAFEGKRSLQELSRENTTPYL
ncbi:MAG: zinc ribbon domain-containing protein [Geobacter sp.]|nr:MAG: zinc ribbon domain-containing protein [Geobacter sp.]